MTFTLDPDAASQVTGGSSLVHVGFDSDVELYDIVSSSASQLYVRGKGASRRLFC